MVSPGVPLPCPRRRVRSAAARDVARRQRERRRSVDGVHGRRRTAVHDSRGRQRRHRQDAQHLEGQLRLFRTIRRQVRRAVVRLSVHVDSGAPSDLPDDDVKVDWMHAFADVLYRPDPVHDPVHRPARSVADPQQGRGTLARRLSLLHGGQRTSTAVRHVPPTRLPLHLPATRLGDPAEHGTSRSRTPGFCDENQRPRRRSDRQEAVVEAATAAGMPTARATSTERPISDLV